MDDYEHLDAIGLAERVRARDVSPEDLLEAALTRAERAQARYNCFTGLFEDAARRQIAAGLGDGPLAGVPFATKDLGVKIAGLPLTNGSRAFRDQVADADSEIVRRYRAAGLVLMGQTTSPEFGLTTSTESALYGRTLNPWDETRSSGGSSGGASSAVAAGVLPMAQASDGGGSIRIPAACTGLVGLKPSRGRVPMGPGKTESWNGFSTVHCVSRSVRDTAALLDVTHGIEPGARSTAPAPEETFLAAAARTPRPLRIALWRTAPNGTGPDAEATSGLEATARLLESLGHTVEEAAPALDGEALGKAQLMVIAAAMAATADARARELGGDLAEDAFEPVSWRFIELGRTVPMMELVKADEACMQAADTYDRFLTEQGFDLVLAPTLARAPERLGLLSLAPDDFDAYGAAITSYAPWCGLFNQTGAPAISLPLHWTAATDTAPEGLPLGMMFGARYGAEGLLLSLAGQLETASPWAARRPRG